MFVSQSPTYQAGLVQFILFKNKTISKVIWASWAKNNCRKYNNNNQNSSSYFARSLQTLQRVWEYLYGAVKRIHYNELQLM